VLYGAVKDIKQQFKENLFRVDFAENHAQMPDFRNLNIVERTPQYIKLKIADERETNSVLRFLLDSGMPIKAYNEILPSLNEIFIKQVGEANVQQ
jgi:ABC-2 type transport system ATP-binding protein